MSDSTTSSGTCNSGDSANQEILGIGIRASIYAQAFLALAPAAIGLLFGKLHQDQRMPKSLREAFETNSTAVLTTGCALLVAAYVQSGNHQLDLYDAIIILQLSWMNNLTAAFPTVYLFAEHGWLNRGALQRFGLYSLHSTATGIFGIWLFSDPASWVPGCADQLNIVLGGHFLSIVGPNLRDAVLFVSVLALVPGLNGFLIGIIALLLRLFRKRWLQWFPLVFWIIPIIVLICSTEQFIFWNGYSGSVEGSEGSETWGFGQMTAILLVAFSAWSLLVLVFKMTFKKLWGGEEEAEGSEGGGEGAEEPKTGGEV